MTHGAGREPIRNILPCHDGPPEAGRALARAPEMARTPGTSVAVIRVAESIYKTPPFSGYAHPHEGGEHQHLLAEACRARADRGVTATPVERIGAAADVIVVSRDRGLLQRLLPGSMSGELVVEGPCDVLVVR